MNNAIEDAPETGFTLAGVILTSWSRVPDITGMMGPAQKKVLAVWKDKGGPLPSKPREK